jgi:hypothetical protein
MYRLAEHEDLLQRRKEIRHEATVEHKSRMERTDRQPRPYVVRDLSWELARYIDTEIFSDGTPQ